jgi:hypothetical protein
VSVLRNVVLAVLLTLPWWTVLQADPDLWGHTYFGLAHLETGHLATTDPYSFTAAGSAWINHEWLTELVLGALFRLGGDVALFWFRAAMLVAFTALFLFLIGKRIAHPAAPVIAAFVLQPYAALFLNLRPQLITGVLLLLVLAILESRGRWALPIVLAFWANAHGGWVLGYVVVLTRVGRDWRLALACAVAPLVNPWGLDLARFLYGALSLDRPWVPEWHGLDARTGYHALWFVAVPLVIVGAVRAFDRRLDLVYFAVAAWAGVTHGRFFLLLVVFSLLLIAGQLGTIVRGTRGATALTVVVVAVGIWPGLRDVKAYGPHVQVAPGAQPIGAVRYLAERPELGPNLALEFPWGEYAIWHLFPRFRVSVDGRYETVYDPAFVERVQKATFEGSVDEFTCGGDVALVSTGSPLDQAFRTRGDWKPAYADSVATIFVPADRVLDERAPSPPPTGGTRFP